MCHSFVEEMLCEGLCVVSCQRRNHGNNHFANIEIAMRLEAQNLIRCIQKILLHELGTRTFMLIIRKVDEMRLTMPAWSNNSRYVSKEP